MSENRAKTLIHKHTPVRHTDPDFPQIVDLILSGDNVWHAVSTVKGTPCHCADCKNNN